MHQRNLSPILGHDKHGRPIHLIAGASADGDPQPFTLPDNLADLTAEDLAGLHARAVAEFDALYAADTPPTAASLARATELAAAIDALTAENTTRQRQATDMANLRGRVDAARDFITGEQQRAGQPPPEEPEPAAEPASTPPAEPGGPTPTEPAPEPPAEPVTAAADRTPARTAPRETGGLNPQRGRLNASLRDAQAVAPDPQVPAREQDLVITAAAATAGAPIGSRFDNLDGLARFINQHARSLTVTNGNPSYTPFASIRSRREQTLGENSDPATVEDTLRRLTDPGVLVAAGGWCAPSEIRYDFFNVACQARTSLLDLPTIGIDRGGIRWPTSPSMADVFTNPTAFVPFSSQTFNATSMPWLWTEGDDIAAVTGTGTKPCIRVPCATFNEARLECFGYCLTAGNLADSAYPEATANFLQMLMAAQIRVENLRYITQVVSLSTLATAASGTGCVGAGAAAPLLGAIELAAYDYRTKYGMCDDDILEVVLPTWVMGVIRSDLAKRTGQDLAAMSVTNTMIADWLDARGVRVQLVGEYQARTAGFPGQATAVTVWPTTVEFLIYAAGTFVRGDGMSLDLGVVRDSTLNAKNDHTAAWTENCHLIARFGHEARRYVVPICPDGTTGAADLTACCY